MRPRLEVRATDAPPPEQGAATVWIDVPPVTGLGPAQWDGLLWEAARQRWPDWPAVAGDAARLARAARLDLPCPPRPWPALAAVLGAPDLVVHVRAAALDEPSADVTSRTLEAAQAQLPGARLVWWVPEAQMDLPGVVRLRAPEPAPPETGRATKSTARTPAAPAVRFTPIEGRPHPASPAELALHRAIEAAADLAGRFAYNLGLETDEGRCIVDLVCVKAGVCAEVDGYRFHGHRAAFARDRHRDFLLAARGWRVLRLTHDEVFADPDHAAALAKIRALLRAPKEPEHARIAQ